ncbi:MAG: hypothetical protein ACOH1V_04125 [Stenotrophomonas sp.]
MTYHTGQQFQSRLARPILEVGFADVKRARLAFLTVLEMTAVVLSTGDSATPDLIICRGIAQQLCEIWRFIDGLTDAVLSVLRQLRVHTQVCQ